MFFGILDFKMGFKVTVSIKDSDVFLLGTIEYYLLVHYNTVCLCLVGINIFDSIELNLLRTKDG